MSSVSDAVKFLDCNDSDKIPQDDKIFYKENPDTHILENCLVIQNDKIVQINLKKGKIRNYDDVFGKHGIKIVFACNSANVYSLDKQRRAARNAETIQLNVAVWTKDEKYQSNNQKPNMEKLFKAEIVKVNSSDMQVLVLPPHGKKRPRAESSDIRSFFLKK
jgi:hypothetical protein